MRLLQFQVYPLDSAWSGVVYVKNRELDEWKPDEKQASILAAERVCNLHLDFSLYLLWKWDHQSPCSPDSGRFLTTPAVAQAPTSQRDLHEGADGRPL